MTKTERDKLRKQALVIDHKLRAAEDYEWLTANRQKLGTCWKYRHSYSCPKEESDYWWAYLRVTGIKTSMKHFETFEFQTDCHGDHDIRHRQFAYLTGWIECSEEEYQQAWNRLLLAINGERA